MVQKSSNVEYIHNCDTVHFVLSVCVIKSQEHSHYIAKDSSNGISRIQDIYSMSLSDKYHQQTTY